MLGDVATANWGADWGAGSDSIHITFKNRLLYIDACKDNDCTTNIVTTYTLKNGRFLKVYAQTHKRKN